MTKEREEATERPNAMTFKRAMIDQSPSCPVYTLMIVVRRPADAFKSVGLHRLDEDVSDRRENSHEYTINKPNVVSLVFPTQPPHNG